MESILAKALGQESTPSTVAEKRDLLARLLGRLAHEIRNPLSSLDIHVQLLEEDLAGLAPQVREPMTARLEVIRGEIHRLESIVGQFLRLAGPSELDVEPVDIPRLVQHVCDLLRPEAAARRIQIVTEIETGLPRVMADPVRLTQALMNLVINAVQAIERDGKLEVSGGLADGVLSLTVQDSGPGIPPEKLRSIFDPYFTTKSEGSGLGLWIAQQIVTAHGGSLTAQNAASGGALFTLRLPVRMAPN